jgi:hypothetical protein
MSTHQAAVTRVESTAPTVRMGTSPDHRDSSDAADLDSDLFSHPHFASHLGPAFTVRQHRLELENEAKITKERERQGNAKATAESVCFVVWIEVCIYIRRFTNLANFRLNRMAQIR